MELADSSLAVSDFVKKTLAQFGWAEGDPIPVELGPRLVAIREQLPASPRTDVLVDASQMSAEDIAAAQAMLKEAKALGAARAKRKEATQGAENLNPAAQSLLQLAVGDEDQGFEFIDDRGQAPPAPAPAPEPAQAPEDEEEPAEADEAAAPMAILPFCPRCGWDMRQKFEIVPTEQDKEDFLSATLGGTRFRRDYQLFGGKMTVSFSTILADDNKMIHRQLVLDQNEKKITTEAEWFVAMQEYRTAMSLQSIVNENGKPIALVPSIDTLPPSDKETPLTALTNYVNTEILAHEVTRRLVGQHLRQFQRLVEALEAMALEPSFWNGIN